MEFFQPGRYGQPKNPVNRWFAPVAKQAFERFAPEGWWEQFKTFQGFYVLGADGTAFHYQVVWNLTPEGYLEELNKALHRFESVELGRVELDGAAVAEAEPPRADPSTSVLRVLGRVKVPHDASQGAHQGVGRDHMWVFRDEVKALVDSAREPDAWVAPPRTVVARLVRFQLVDNTRNVAEAFAHDAVQEASFRVKLLSREGHTAHYALEGTYRSEGQGQNHGEAPYGVDGRLAGELTVDCKRLKITRCLLHGEAEAWGQPKTGAPKGRYPIEFAVREANDRWVVVPLHTSLTPGMAGHYRAPRMAIWERK